MEVGIYILDCIESLIGENLQAFYTRAVCRPDLTRSYDGANNMEIKRQGLHFIFLTSYHVRSNPCL